MLIFKFLQYLSIELKQYSIPKIRGVSQVKEISRFVVPTVWQAVRTRAPLLALLNVFSCSITCYLQEKARLSVRYDVEENPALAHEALKAANTVEFPK